MYREIHRYSNFAFLIGFLYNIESVVQIFLSSFDPANVSTSTLTPSLFPMKLNGGGSAPNVFWYLLYRSPGSVRDIPAALCILSGIGVSPVRSPSLHCLVQCRRPDLCINAGDVELFIK